MGRFQTLVPGVAILVAFVGSVSCGGGPAPSIQPPPPAADFSLAVSPNSLSVSAGAASSPVLVSVTALNGFSGNVQVALTGLPGGVTSSPASPFSTPAGGTQNVVFTAALSAVAGNFTVTAQGTSAALSHSAILSLAVQPAPPPSLPRTAFARTDSVPASDVPPGEPHRRHLAYDSLHKRVFVANPAMNRVEVFSSSDQSLAAQIALPAATSADITADGATVYVGSAVEQIAALDAATLTVAARYPVAGIEALPNTIFNLPVEVLALAGGKAMARLRRPNAPMSLLAFWDPATNSFTDLTARAPAVFGNGAGVLARSGDHTKVLAAANDTSGFVVLFNALGNVVALPQSLGSGTIPFAAANKDGTRFAVVLASGSNTRVLLLDASLTVLFSHPTPNPQGLAFSRDANFFYLGENTDLPALISVLDGHDLHFIGQLPDTRIGGRRSEIEEADETGLLFGITNRGVSFLDAAKPGTLPTATPVLPVVPALTPAEGPAAGGTPTTITGQNFESSVQVTFGSQLVQNAAVSGGTQIQAASPPNAAKGPVNVTAYFPSGWIALAPAAFSYGPQILQVTPNAGNKAGGEIIQIYGHGFGNDPAKIGATLGGANATVQSVDSIAALATAGIVGANYPFPIERITLQTPPGAPGKADITVTSPAGTASSVAAFQYLQEIQDYAQPGFYKFILYDRARRLVYLSNVDHVDVFDVVGERFRATGLSLPGGPRPSTQLRGLALTPDGSKLVVADFGAQNVAVLNPDVSGSGTTVSVGGVPGFLNSGPAQVAATSTSKVFVGLTADGPGGCSTCLGQFDLLASPPSIQVPPQPEVSTLTGAPLLQGTAKGDQVFLAFGSAPGGPVAVWQSVTDHFTASAGNAPTADLGAAADGTIFAVRANGGTQLRGADLILSAIPATPELATVPGRVAVPGATLHPSGALLYEPFLTGPPGTPGVRGGVDISDVRTGALRLRILLSQPLATDVDGLHGSFLTTDDTGTKLFALTTKGLTVVELASVPLSIGTVSPAAGPAAGGTQITIRGSGFQNGVKVAFGGVAASVTFVDAGTLRVATPALKSGAQQITVTNPDGETVTLDAAFTAN
jgi:hypothetical protein